MSKLCNLLRCVALGALTVAAPSAFAQESLDSLLEEVRTLLCLSWHRFRNKVK